LIGMGRTHAILNSVEVQKGRIWFYRYTLATEGMPVPNTVSATVL
jgi:hypothetical protein